MSLSDISDPHLLSADGTGAHKRKREMDAGDHDQHRLRGHPPGELSYDTELPHADFSQIDQELLRSVGHSVGHHVGNQNGVNVNVGHVGHPGGLGAVGTAADDNALTAKAALAAHAPSSQSKYPPPDPAAAASPFDSNPAAALTHGLTFGEEVAQVGMGSVQAAQQAQAQAQAQAEAAAAAGAGTGEGAGAYDPGRETPTGPGGHKPTVGSPEWHSLRKNNHKEVERRRREAINEGINEIAKMVPGAEKAKGSILQRAISYIHKLQSDSAGASARNEQQQNLFQQTLAEISQANYRLKEEVNRRGDVANKWITRCREAGLHFDDYEDEKSLGHVREDGSVQQ